MHSVLFRVFLTTSGCLLFQITLDDNSNFYWPFHCKPTSSFSAGTNVEEARKILNESGLAITTGVDFEDAARKAVASLKKQLFTDKRLKSANDTRTSLCVLIN